MNSNPMPCPVPENGKGDFGDRISYTVTAVPMRPIGLNFFAGKVSCVFDHGADAPVAVAFPEVWGRTPREARLKAADAIERWLLERQPVKTGLRL